MSREKTLVLVVDDDPGVLKLVSRSLEAGGYQVVTAEDGETALQLVERENPSLVLLDIIMPGMDGLQVCRRIRDQTDIPVILLTGKNRVEATASALNIGANDCIAKPFTHQELLARVKAVLQRTKF